MVGISFEAVASAAVLSGLERKLTDSDGAQRLALFLACSAVFLKRK